MKRKPGLHQYLLPQIWLPLLLFCLNSCESTQRELDKINKKQLAIEEARNVESYLSQAGIVKARLTAPVMIRHTADSVRVEFPKTLHTEFFLDPEKLLQAGIAIDTQVVESHIYSLYGKYTEYDNKVYLRDSVVAFNVLKRDTLWCDELWWDQDKRIIYTQSRFRYKTHDGQDMKGDGKNTGFQAKQDFSEYTLFHSKGTMMAPQGSIPY
jgi:hypothetical protein